MKTLTVCWIGAALVVLLSGVYSLALDWELEALGIITESGGTLSLILTGTGMLVLAFGWEFTAHQKAIKEWREEFLPEDDLD